MKRTSLLACVAIASAALLLGCAQGPPAKSTIGPYGGELQSQGLLLRIPRGALHGTHEISVTTRGTPMGGTTPLYHFEPHGLRFDTPAIVEMDAAETDHPIVLWSSSTRRGFDKLYPTVIGSKMLVSVNHFSDGFGGDDAAPPPEPITDEPAPLCTPGDTSCCDGVTLNPANPGCSDGTGAITGCHSNSDCVDPQKPVCCGNGFCQVTCGTTPPTPGCGSSGACARGSLCCPSGRCSMSCSSQSSGSGIDSLGGVGCGGAGQIGIPYSGGSDGGSGACNSACISDKQCGSDCPICYKGQCII